MAEDRTEAYAMRRGNSPMWLVENLIKYRAGETLIEMSCSAEITGCFGPFGLQLR